MGNNLENFIKLTDDILFKETFGNVENIKYLEDFIESYLKLKKGSLKNKLKVSYESQIPKGFYNQKEMRADLMVVVDNDFIINLEMFTTFNDKSYLKSKEYIMRIHTVQLHSAEEYQNVKKIEQLNIMEEVKTKKYKMKESLVSEEVLILDKLKTVYYRLDLLPKNAYNIDRFTKWLYFIAADTKEKRDEVARGDKILMDLNKWLEEYQNDESLRRN